MTQSFNYYQGALDGSALARLNILQELSSLEPANEPFLNALKQLLLDESIDPSRLLLHWSRICDVPEAATQNSTVQVRSAMRLLSEFRNRFAHVPFPYDGLDDLAGALESVTEQLFSIEPKPWQVFRDDGRLESPLCGAILWRDRILHGNMHKATGAKRDGIWFAYPPTRKRSQEPEVWRAEPFVYVDSMLRAYVLTRLRAQSTGVWEFTRFRAEASAILNHDAPEWLSLVTAPAEAEYKTPEDIEEQEEEAKLVASVSPVNVPEERGSRVAPVTEFEQALRYIRNEEYEPAIEYFTRLVEARPAYHIGWLRLGHAQRELAMRKRASDPVRAGELFSASIDSLTRATGHAYSDRKAQALYERSKAYYQRGRFRGDKRDLDRATADALESHTLHADTVYESWIGYLKSHMEDGQLDRLHTSRQLASAGPTELAADAR